MSDVYYKVRKGSEAHNVIHRLLQKRKERFKEVEQGIKELGSDPKKYLTYYDGSFAGAPFDEQPEGWKKIKGFPGFYVPYAKNKKAWAKIPDMKGVSSQDLTIKLFNKEPFSLDGGAYRRGIYAKEKNGIYYISHVECDGVEPILKGMRKIKKSTYIKEVEE